MHFLDRRQLRPVTDALRATVLEDLPEFAQVRNEELRHDRGLGLCAGGNGFSARQSHSGRGDAWRLRAEARQPGDTPAQRSSYRDSDRRRVCPGISRNHGRPRHRSGRCAAARCRQGLGVRPRQPQAMEADKSQAGSPSLRHPVYGAHICIAVGLPEEIAHIALGHSSEGVDARSLECLIVHRADHMWWSIAGVSACLRRKRRACSKLEK